MAPDIAIFGTRRYHIMKRGKPSVRGGRQDRVICMSIN